MSDRRLFDLSFEGLTAHVETLGLPRYRAQQIWHGVYVENATSYQAITTLSKTLRETLARELPWTTLDLIRLEQAADGCTAKALFRLEDGETIESVIMHYEGRNTLCVSTQVGCAMGCSFCATGLGGFVRDLATGEIVAQARYAAHWLDERGLRLTNLVYMGMGEPLVNYDATMSSIRILNDAQGMNIGARSFTISTVGIPPAIGRLAGEPIQVNLAVSLHAGTDALRDQLVPASRRYPLHELLLACRTYVETTNRRITFEITLIEGVNDGDDDAEAVIQRVSGMLCHVNLIPLNPDERTHLRPSADARVRSFAHRLEAAGIPVSIRDSRGEDIKAGCGQLRARDAVD